jgi:hypothetical protein
MKLQREVRMSATMSSDPGRIMPDLVHSGPDEMNCRECVYYRRSRADGVCQCTLWRVALDSSELTRCAYGLERVERGFVTFERNWRKR